MSPREKHIPADAHRTSISFTPEDRTAINWVSLLRRGKGDRRNTINDIVVDALWYYIENGEGMTREKIQAMVPAIPVASKPKNKVTQMPKPKR